MWLEQELARGDNPSPVNVVTEEIQDVVGQMSIVSVIKRQVSGFIKEINCILVALFVKRSSTLLTLSLDKPTTAWHVSSNEMSKKGTI